MPTFEFTSPDGKKYSVQGPAGATQEQAFAILQQQLGGAAEKQKRADADMQKAREEYAPTVGMSGPERFLAGVGKGMTDVARGVGQMVGAVDRDDVAQSRRLDSSLMDTGAGMAGNIAGSVAALAPTVFIPGANTMAGAALIGAGTGLAQPSTSTKETLTNIGIGGVVGPAAIAAGRGIQAAKSGLGAVRDTFTQSGQTRIAQDILRASATNADDAARNLLAAKPLVQGSAPTAGQAARDPGIAQLERTFLNNPELAAPMQSRYAAQRAARMSAVQDVAGTDEYYNAIKAGRSVFANEDYAKALKQGIDPKMAESLRPQIESLMGRPSIQQAQKVAQSLARESDQVIDDFGSLEGMDWLKKALDNQISKATQPGSSIGKQELRALLQTKDDLMSTLDTIAPGYKAANDNFAAMSGQVNSMDVARDLLKRYEPASAQYGNSAREMGNAYQKALAGATESVKKQTGMNKGISEVMNPDDVRQLEAVARDIARQQYAQEAGRAVGSPTAQNMISQNMLRRFLGPTGLPEGMADNTILQTLLRPVEFAGRVATPKIQSRLAEIMLDPQQAAQALQTGRVAQTIDPSGNQLLRMLTQPTLLTGGFAANRSQQ